MLTRSRAHVPRDEGVDLGGKFLGGKLIRSTAATAAAAARRAGDAAWRRRRPWRRRSRVAPWGSELAGDATTRRRRRPWRRRSRTVSWGSEVVGRAPYPAADGRQITLLATTAPPLLGLRLRSRRPQSSFCLPHYWHADFIQHQHPDVTCGLLYGVLANMMRAFVLADPAFSPTG
jgi:hypothetical protein